MGCHGAHIPAADRSKLPGSCHLVPLGMLQYRQPPYRSVIHTRLVNHYVHYLQYQFSQQSELAGNLTPATFINCSLHWFIGEETLRLKIILIIIS